MRGVGTRAFVSLAAVVLLSAACGDGEGDAGDGTTDPGGIYGGTTGETSATGPTGATAATGSTGETGAAADATVSLSNYQFSPADLEVASGTVLEVVNVNTRAPHTFTVVGQDVDVELAPMSSETTQIDLEPGTYDVICRFHESLGMTGTLTVT